VTETEESMVRQMIAYLQQEVLRSDDAPIDEDTPLFSSGVMDSMAVVDVLHKLEDVTGRRIPTGRLRLKDVDTVRQMLAAARRVGQPRA